MLHKIQRDEILPSAKTKKAFLHEDTGSERKCLLSLKYGYFSHGFATGGLYSPPGAV